VSAGREFIQALLGELPQEARSAALRVLQAWGGTSVYIPLSESHRREEVASLLLRAMTAAEAAPIVADRFGVSLSQARRILRKVREARGTVSAVDPRNPP
jgi:Mor family transcriptional regulator